MSLQLYARVEGKNKAVGRLRKLILDDTVDEHVRATAAQQLPRVAPEIPIYRELFQKYDELPPNVAYRLASAAARSKQSPGAEEFVIKALGDPRLEDHMLSSICFHIRLPESEKLREALEKLQGNDRVKNAAQHIMGRWDRRKDRERGGRGARPAAVAHRTPARASAADYPEQVKELEQDTRWKKTDSVNGKLTWYARKSGGVAIADAEHKKVISPGKLLGHENVQVNALAFDKDKVWLGTSVGLIAWDRELRFWTLVATGAGQDVPVKDVTLEDGQLRVIAESKGGQKTVWERMDKGAWKPVQDAPR